MKRRHFATTSSPFSVLLAAIVLVGCTGDAEKASTAAASPASTARPTETAKANDTTAKSMTAGGIVCKPPTDWIVEQPTSGMRKAQFRIPKVAPDTEDASLVIFYFGRDQGGSPQANIDRWTGQFEQPDGKSSKDALQSSQRTVGSMAVHDVDLSGTYVAETSPGSGERVNKPGWRMLASIVTAPTGPYYLKLVGPAATVAHAEPAYRRFVSELAPAP